MRSRLLERFVVAVIGVAALGACQRTLSPIQVLGQPDAPAILLLRSSANPFYNASADAFIAQTTPLGSVYDFVLPDGNADLSRQLEQLRPDLIVALGTKAAKLAREEAPEIPMLFAMVVNYQQFEFLDSKTPVGISLELPPMAEFSQFKIVVPQLSRVVVFCSSSSRKAEIERASADLAKLGITVLAIEIESVDDLIKRYKTLPQDINAVWMAVDPVVMSPKGFEFLKSRAKENNRPLLASLSDRFARAGAHVSVSVEFGTLGSQAANLARRMLVGGESPAELGVQNPIGAKLVVNATELERIDAAIPEDMLPFVNELLYSDQ